MKFTWIAAERAVWPVRRMCRVLGVSASGFYAWLVREESPRAKEDRRLGILIKAYFDRSRGNYGSPRVHRELCDGGHRVGRNRVIRLMRAQKLRGRARRRFATTTDSKHSLPAAPNLLARDFTASKPNERWVGDVTYLRTPMGFLYLATIIDLFSRMVVGWALSAVNDRRVVLRALDAAVRRRRPRHGLLHHTDRGSTYASEDYQKELDSLGLTCSMSRRGNCLDNAAMESWHSTLKAELGEDFESPADAHHKLFDYIEVFYNGQRMHSTLGYVSPREFERRFMNTQALPGAPSASGSPFGRPSAAGSMIGTEVEGDLPMVAMR